MSRFVQALAQLLPQGLAWPRDPASVWMRLVAGLAGAFEELHGVTHQAVAEWQPHSTRTRLAEWEEATGLPDPCFGANQTVAERQARVLARLRGVRGAYADSSPAALGAIQAYCTALGVNGVVSYNTPFRVGRNRAKQRLGFNNGKLYLTVTGSSTPLRVGRRVGARLVQRPAEVAELLCAMERVVPARFELAVSFV